MADFRKWFVALAVLVGMVGTAYGQAFQCTANAGVPAGVRGEGRAELVGDVLLNCSGLSTVAVTANIQIFLSTNITSRIINTSTNETEALLFLNEPPSNGLVLPLEGPVPNTWRGIKAGDNSLLWTNIPIVAALGTVATVRITNVRANAVQAFGGGQTFIPQQITMFIIVTGSTAIPLNNPTQVVAGVLKGVDFAVRNCADDGGGSKTYSQCVSNNKDLYADSTKTGQSIQGLLKFTENLVTAYKIRLATVGCPLGPPGQDGCALGAVFPGSESGYSNTAELGPSTGFASQGTRLIARFASIPAGMKIFVTTAPHPNASSTSVTAVLVSVSDPTGTGGAVGFPIGGTGKAKCGSGTVTTDQDIVEVPLFGGAGAATWEITGADPSAFEKVAFGVVVTYKADPANNIPALTGATPGTVSGNFAPISADDKMSAVSPIPRFADLPVSATLLKVDSCAATLLFPFVTARGGFDTGIAISNTTLDNSKDMPGGTNEVPYKTPPQNGVCTLYYFGDKEDGTSLEAPIQTSGVINAGKQLVYTLFGGGAGIAASPGFQGYIIAQCKFQLAHGFAFISDLGAQKLAMGYLALVMAKNSGDRTDGVSFEALDN